MQVPNAAREVQQPPIPSNPKHSALRNLKLSELIKFNQNQSKSIKIFKKLKSSQRLKVGRPLKWQVRGIPLLPCEEALAPILEALDSEEKQLELLRAHPFVELKRREVPLRLVEAWRHAGWQLDSNIFEVSKSQIYSNGRMIH